MVKRAKVERVTSGPWAGRTVAEAERIEAWIEKQLALAPPMSEETRAYVLTTLARNRDEREERERQEREAAEEAAMSPAFKRGLVLWETVEIARRDEEAARAELAAAVARREAAEAELAAGE